MNVLNINREVLNKLPGADDSLTDIIDTVDTSDAALEPELVDWFYRAIGDAPEQGLFVV